MLAMVAPLAYLPARLGRARIRLLPERPVPAPRPDCRPDPGTPAQAPDW